MEREEFVQKLNRCHEMTLEIAKFIETNYAGEFGLALAALRVVVVSLISGLPEGAQEECMDHFVAGLKQGMEINAEIENS